MLSVSRMFAFYWRIFESKSGFDVFVHLTIDLDMWIYDIVERSADRAGQLNIATQRKGNPILIEARKKLLSFFREFARLNIPQNA